MSLCLSACVVGRGRDIVAGGICQRAQDTHIQILMKVQDPRIARFPTGGFSDVRRALKAWCEKRGKHMDLRAARKAKSKAYKMQMI